MSAPKKLYRKVKKTVLIDSRDRSPLCTQSKYSVSLPRTLDNVYSVTLRSAELPFSWYMFSRNNGNTSFVAFDPLLVPLVPIDIVIPDGNYTGTTFATAIQTAMQVNFANLTVTYNTTTNKLVFSSIDEYSLDFTQTQTQAICGDPIAVRSKTSWWGLGYFMGFNKKVYRAVINAAGTAYELTSDFSVQLNDGNYILMELDFCNKEDETALDGRLSGRVDACFAKIPINGNSGDIIFFREWCCPMNKTILSPPIGQLKTLNIKFRCHDGRLIEFNNVDHSLTLEFELLENNFDEYSSLDFSH